jgi:subtilisin family serine protease
MVLLLLASCLRGLAASPSVVATNNPPTQIVCCQDGVEVDALIKEYGFKPTHRYRHALHGFAAPMDSATIKKLQSDSRVLTVEADGIVAPADQIIPPGITRIGADTFPVGRSNATYLPLNVDVAILDSGIDPHPDLPANYQEYSTFTGIDGSDSLAGSSADPNGHGTLVAGVIAAQDNGFGVVGVAPGVRIWNVKSFGPPPWNNWTDVLDGMDFVANNSDQISVANMSIGSKGTNAPVGAIRLGLHAMVHAGIVVLQPQEMTRRTWLAQTGSFNSLTPRMIGSRRLWLTLWP